MKHERAHSTIPTSSNPIINTYMYLYYKLIYLQIVINYSNTSMYAIIENSYFPYLFHKRFIFNRNKWVCIYITVMFLLSLYPYIEMVKAGCFTDVAG